jgi:hypothetical protein
VHDLRIGENIGQRVDRPGRNAPIFQGAQQLAAIVARQKIGERFDQLRAICHARGVGYIPGICGE